MTAVAPSTKLAIVNRVLSVIGEQPVLNLSNPMSAETALAIQIVDEVDLEAQSRGWHFNSDYQVPLTPDVNGKIPMPANAARISFDRVQYPNYDITIRDDTGLSPGLNLYDKKARTFVFGGTINAQIVYLFDIEKTPEPYRRYVMVRAGRIFQDRVLGSQPHHQFNTVDETIALRNLKQHEDRTDPRTIFDSYDAFRVIDRQYPYTQSGINLRNP